MTTEAYIAAGFGFLAVTLIGICVKMLTAQNSTMQTHGTQLAAIQTVLTGQSGNNGLHGDVKDLRVRTHSLGDSIQSVIVRLSVLEDRRVGDSDRRHG